MGNTALQVPIAKISTAVTSLTDCSESAAALYKYMTDNEMRSVWSIWSDNTDKLLRAVRKLNNDLKDALAEEETARSEGRQNHYEKQKEKSRRDAEAKKNRTADVIETTRTLTRKKPGRPTKKKGE